MPATSTGGGGKRKYGPTSQSHRRVVQLPATKRVRPVKLKTAVATFSKTSSPGKSPTQTMSPKPKPSSPPKKEDEKKDNGRRTRTRPNPPKGNARGRDKNPPGQKKTK